MLPPMMVISGLVLLLQGASINSGVATDVNGVRIEDSSLHKTNNTLVVSYRIKNGSREDVWLCETIWRPTDFEAYLAQDRGTVMIRRRFDAKSSSKTLNSAPTGSYVRLPRGESRNELMVLPWPVWAMTAFATDSATDRDVVVNANRLVIEIGFYSHDLFIKDLLQKGIRVNGEDYRIRFAYGEIDRTAQVLAVVFDHQAIAYVPRLWGEVTVRPPFLRECRQIEIEFKPSMLEYFYPGNDQRAMFDSDDKEYLQSRQSTIVNDSAAILDLHEGVQEGLGALAVCSGPTAEMICRYRIGAPERFTFYADRTLAMEDRGVLRYEYGVPSLRMVTSQIQPFEVRLQCADNLRRLMDRTRRRGIEGQDGKGSASGVRQRVYPQTERWCDGIVQAWPGVKPEDLLALFKCPSKKDGKCNYAMNPNCEPNSPKDTVLLFETKDGWNQHGGPELFTFDNHDPKGGCVILNDGTVKFIRTKEELAQLRWKP